MKNRTKGFLMLAVPYAVATIHQTVRGDYGMLAMGITVLLIYYVVYAFYLIVNGTDLDKEQ